VEAKLLLLLLLPLLLLGLWLLRASARSAV
jgi:hypothetical protein